MGLSINTVGAFERLPFVWRGQIKQIGPIEPLLQVQCKLIPLPEGLQLVPFDTVEERVNFSMILHPIILPES